MIYKQQATNFYTPYFMDVMCGGQNFPSMNWEWKRSSPPIHVYCLDLWENRYKYNYMRIYNNFLIPL